MDLLRQIWLRAPLSALSTVGKALSNQGSAFSPGGMLDDDWFRQRNRVVNRLPEAAFEEYLTKLTGLTRNRLLAYILLSVLQGARPPKDYSPIDSKYLCARAAFLRDAKMYNDACRDEIAVEIDLERALISDVPEIQAWALTFAKDPWNVPDPELIRWTPQLIRYYASLTQPETSTAYYLSGYLHLPPPHYAMKNVAYWSGYLSEPQQSSVSRQSRDPGSCPGYSVEIEAILKQNFPVTNEIEFDYLLEVCGKSGYFSPRLLRADSHLLVDTALKCVQPSWIAHLPKLAIEKASIDIPTSQYITADLVERARRMIPLIESYYPNLTIYMTQLRILCGMRIDISEFIHNTPSQRMSEFLISQVAHPQAGFSVSPEIKSSVHYDIADLVQNGAFPRKWKFISLLYGVGRILKAYPPNQLPILVTELGRVYSDGGDLTLIHEKHNRILAMLR